MFSKTRHIPAGTCCPISKARDADQQAPVDEKMQKGGNGILGMNL